MSFSLYIVFSDYLVITWLNNMLHIQQLFYYWLFYPSPLVLRQGSIFFQFNSR